MQFEYEESEYYEVAMRRAGQATAEITLSNLVLQETIQILNQIPPWLYLFILLNILCACSLANGIID